MELEIIMRAAVVPKDKLPIKDLMISLHRVSLIITSPYLVE
jgi:hypothetical protein